jgi:hypothetical protein
MEPDDAMKWDVDELEAFFQMPAELRHTERTEFVFKFPVGYGCAQLHISPFNQCLRLMLSANPQSHPFASWHFDCRSLRVHHDENYDEGGEDSPGSEPADRGGTVTTTR